MMIKPTPNIKMLYWGTTSLRGKFYFFMQQLIHIETDIWFRQIATSQKSLPNCTHSICTTMQVYGPRIFLFCLWTKKKKKISEVLPKPEPGQLLLRCQISVASLIAEVGNIRWRWPCRRDGYYQGTNRLPCVSEQWSKFVVPDNQVPCTVRVPRTPFKPNIQHEYFPNSLER